MLDIFLSYSRDDSVFMQTLLNNLRKLGFNVWIDEEHLVVGTPEWETAIEEAVKRVDALIVIMTPSSKASRWVNIELRLADLHGTSVFPILAVGDERTAVPPRLLGMQYADMRGRSDYEGGFRQLINGLAAHMGLTVGAFSIDFSGEPQVQVNVYGQNEGTIVAVGRDVAGDLNVAGGDIVQSESRAKSAQPAEKRRQQSPAHDPILDVLPPPFEWLPIPAGRVTLEDNMGTHDVERFMIAKYPLTNAQFQVFVDAADGYRETRWWDYSKAAQAWRESNAEPRAPAWDGPANHPRVNVTWFEAVAFCRWLSGKVGYEMRLPAETEWQRAAQGDDGRTYPWGSQEPDDRLANWKQNVGKTTPVGNYPDGASPYGVLDMAGNVWEWCVTDYESGDSDIGKAAKRRVLRGGSWLGITGNLRAAYRFRFGPVNSDNDFGFRCARSF